MPEFATVYSISPSEESTLAVEVVRSGVLGRKKRHTLAFVNFSGEMHFAGSDPVGSRIVLRVDASSIVCRDSWMRENRRQAVTDFLKDTLAASVYPEIAFSSTSVRAKALRGFVITGQLQIRGTCRELKINMSLNPARTREFQLDADAILRLSDFGLPRPSAMFGLIGTRDEAVVHARLWAVPM